MSVWQLQRLQFNLLSEHGNVLNRTELESIDDSEVTSFNFVKEAIHSSFWKGINGPKRFKDVLNGSLA